LMTRRALDILKTIATGEYKPEAKEEQVEESQADVKTEPAENEEKAG